MVTLAKHRKCNSSQGVRRRARIDALKDRVPHRWWGRGSACSARAAATARTATAARGRCSPAPCWRTATAEFDYLVEIVIDPYVANNHGALLQSLLEKTNEGNSSPWSHMGDRPEDTVEHTVAVCPAWAGYRRVFGDVVSDGDLSRPALIQVVVRSEGEWDAVIAAVSSLFEEWLERRHGVLTYRLTQVLTGHGSFELSFVDSSHILTALHTVQVWHWSPSGRHSLWKECLQLYTIKSEALDKSLIMIRPWHAQHMKSSVTDIPLCWLMINFWCKNFGIWVSHNFLSFLHILAHKIAASSYKCSAIKWSRYCTPTVTTECFVVLPPTSSRTTAKPFSNQFGS
uniref:SFRICE_014380 n=1 Tax=Spodoptera frugiperda TaxID=7108 RepID=A0A2H1WTH7_SPOFR